MIGHGRGAAHSGALSSIFSGAGISCAAPALLPLGEGFHRDLLRGCLDAVDRFAPGLLGEPDHAALSSWRWNVLARLAASAEEAELSAVTSVLGGLRVVVPTEAHLLAAVHLAAGGLHVTVNLDDGIERAYALLSGGAELPASAPASLTQALAAWRSRFPRNPARLRVAHSSTAVRRARRGLVKLRGSFDAPQMLVGARPAVDTAESVHLGRSRTAVLNRLTDGFVVVTGFSGADLDCTQALLPRLRPGAFCWAAPRVDHHLAARLRQIDPDQPQFGRAAECLRTLLAGHGHHLPPWPQISAMDVGYADQIGSWERALPGALAVQACGWMLADAGRRDRAVEVLDYLAARSPSGRAAVRLADVLYARNAAGDRLRAGALYAAATGRGAAPRPVRMYAVARSARQRSLPGRIAALGVLAVREPVRASELAADLVVAAAAGQAVLGRVLRTAAGCTAMVVRRALACIRHRTVGVGRRHAALYVRLAMLEALSTGVRAATLTGLDWAMDVYTHLGDADGCHRAHAARAYAAGSPRSASSPTPSSVSSPESGSSTTALQGSSSSTSAGVWAAPNSPPVSAATVSVSPPSSTA